MDKDLREEKLGDCLGRVRILAREHHVGEGAARLETILVVDEDPSVDEGLDVSFSDLGDEGDFGALVLRTC